MIAATVLGSLLLAAAAEARLLLFLPLNDTSGTRATDYSGNNRHGSYVNGTQLQGAEGARLDGTNDYIALPADLMRGAARITVSIDVLIRREQSNYYFIFGLGNTNARTGVGAGYVFATGDPYRAAISSASFDSEAEARAGFSLPRDRWTTLAFVVDAPANTIALYRDGAYVGGRTNNNSIVAPASLGGGATSANYIGRSVFTADKYLAGSVRNFRLWDDALPAAQIATPGFVMPDSPAQQQPGPPPPPLSLPANPSAADRVGYAIMTIDLGNAIGEIRGDIPLPQASQGIPIVWTSSNPRVIDAMGRVNRPTGQDALVTLTAMATLDGVRGERSFEVVVRRVGA